MSLKNVVFIHSLSVKVNHSFFLFLFFLLRASGAPWRSHTGPRPGESKWNYESPVNMVPISIIHTWINRLLIKLIKILINASKKNIELIHLMWQWFFCFQLLLCGCACILLIFHFPFYLLIYSLFKVHKPTQ